jgi:DNA mismatch repair protein PMS2
LLVGSVDVNVSPDKRTLFLHAEENLLEELRRALEDRFAPSRSTFDVGGKQVQGTSQLLTQSTLPFITATPFPAPLSTQAPTQAASTQPAVEDEGMVVATPLPTPMVTQLSSTNESARDRQEDAEEDDAEGEENILTSATQQSTPGIETLGRLSSQSLSSLSSPRTSPPPSSLRPQRRMIPTTPSYSSPRTPSSTIICRNRGRSGVKAPGSSSPSRFILHKSFSSPATSSPVSRSRTMTSSSRSSDIITPLFLPDEEDELEDDDEEPDDADMVVPTEHSSEEMMSTQNAAWAHTVSPTTPEDDPEISTSRRRGFVTSENVDDEETVTGYKRSLPPSSRVLPPVLASAKRIHRSPSPQNTPDVKRARTSSSSSSQFPSTRKELRSRLASFVAPGSQARVRVDSSDADDTSSPDVSEPDVTSDGIIRANASSSSPSARALFLNRRPDMRNESRSRPVSSSSPIDLTMDGDVLDLDEPPMSRPFAEDDAVDTQVPLVELNQESSDAFELDLDRLAQRWAASRMIPSSTIASCNPFHTHAPAQGASIVSSPEAASSTLSRIISKSDFEHMTILGQFNLGFILTRLRDDLWIVDQHAADEKYNFEDLQRNTQIRSQRLVRPMKLELSRMDEEVAREHEDVLRQNGFELEWDEEDLEMDKSEGDDHDDGYEEDRGEDENKEDVGGQRSLRLVALPMSKNTVFGMQGE